MEKNKIRLSVNDFKTPTKTYQDNKTLAKQQKRKEISPNDQLNLDKKSRPFSQTVQNPPVNMSVNMNDSALSDETQPPSQSIIYNNMPQDGNTTPQMANVQMPLQSMQPIPFGQAMMGFQPQFQQMQNQSLPQPFCTLPDFEIDRIAARLKETFFADLDVIIAAKVNERTADLSKEIDNLRADLHNVRESLNDMYQAQEEAEQYSRRNCVRISNYKESPDENTDDIVLEVARKANVDIKLNDIDRSHRVPRGKDSDNKPKPGPKEIIVKFTSYKSRTNFIKGRKHLRESKSNIFLNEDLTKFRKELAYECRSLKKNTNSTVSQTWSRDGKIFVKDNQEKIHRIVTMFDIAKFRPFV